MHKYRISPNDETSLWSAAEMLSTQATVEPKRKSRGSDSSISMPLHQLESGELDSTP